MTIAQELLKLAATKAAIKAAIEAKGVVVGSVPFDQYPGKITEITTAPSTIVPVIDGVPAITGAAGIGNVLTAAPAPVSGDPAPVRTWQWLRDTGAGFVEIVGETGSTYTQTGVDAGAAVKVRQIETNSVGQDTADAVAVAVPAALNPFPITEFKGMISLADPPSLLTGNKVYVYAQPVEGAGAISDVSVWGEAAGTLRISVWSLSGGAFTRVAYEDQAFAIGLNNLTFNVPVAAGQYVGFSTGTNCMGMNTTSAGAKYFATTGTNVSVTMAQPGTQAEAQAQIRIRIDMQKSIGALSSVPALSGFDALFLPGVGQSNMEGGDGGSLTTAQEFDTMGMRPYFSAEPNCDDLRPAYVANMGYASGTRDESPIYGAASMFRRSITAEAGVSDVNIKSRVVITSNALGGSPITTFTKGSARYTWLMAKAARLRALYGYRSAALPVLFSQGEEEASQSGVPDDYKAALKLFAVDIDADLRAAFGQLKPVPLVINQISQTYQTKLYRSHGVAQWQASKESPLVILATPMYMLTFTDALHINASGSRIMGAYMGLAAKRHFVDGQKFEPLQPTSVVVDGSDIVVTFNKNGLVIDTATISAQTNSGFAVENAAGVAQAINAVSVESGNKVRITVAAAPAAGWKVKYGVPATGRGTYTGACGNLRDSAGDALMANVTLDGSTTWPLHNWAVLFDWVI